MHLNIQKSRCLLASFACALLSSSSLHAVVQFTYAQVGDDVVLTASGSYDNLTGLTISSTGGVPTVSISYPAGSDTYFYSGAVGGSGDVVRVLDFTLNRIDDSVIATSAPTVVFMEADSTGIVGTGATHARLSTSGSIRLYLPYDNINELPYESVSYSGTSIWEDTTLEDLGLSTGSYEIRWDSGNQGINMTVVPEPSVAALLGVSAIALFTRRRRK